MLLISTKRCHIFSVKTYGFTVDLNLGVTMKRRVATTPIFNSNNAIIFK